MFHEWHAKGSTFEARGAGPPGTPQILVGSSPAVSWGLTALALDQADLFRLDTADDHPGQYRVDGTWTPFANTSNEVVLVKGGEAVHVTFAETIFGPLVTRLVGSSSSTSTSTSSTSTSTSTGAQWALLAIPYARPQASSWSASLALYRAADAASAVGEAVLGGWEFPSCNMVLGDARHGTTAYRMNGAVPVRSLSVPLGGTIAWYGNSTSVLWRGVVPADLNPVVVGPSAGYVLSGNNAPVGPW